MNKALKKSGIVSIVVFLISITVIGILNASSFLTALPPGALTRDAALYGLDDAATRNARLNVMHYSGMDYTKYVYGSNQYRNYYETSVAQAYTSWSELKFSNIDECQKAGFGATSCSVVFSGLQKVQSEPTVVGSQQVETVPAVNVAVQEAMQTAPPAVNLSAASVIKSVTTLEKSIVTAVVLGLIAGIICLIYLMVKRR